MRWPIVLISVLIVFLALYLLARWDFYYRRPWSRVHYPFLRCLAPAAGLETARAELSDRPYDVRLALCGALRAFCPDWSPMQIDAVISRSWERASAFSDRDLLREEGRRRLPHANAADLERLLDMAAKSVSPPDNAVFVRFVIAELVEDRYGSQHRGQYLFELVIGKLT